MIGTTGIVLFFFFRRRSIAINFKQQIQTQTPDDTKKMKRNRGVNRAQSGGRRSQSKEEEPECVFVASFLRRSTSRNPRKVVFFARFLFRQQRVFLLRVFYVLLLFFFFFFLFFSFAREDRIEEKNVFVFVVRSISSKRVINGREGERGGAIRRRRRRLLFLSHLFKHTPRRIWSETRNKCSRRSRSMVSTCTSTRCGCFATTSRRSLVSYRKSLLMLIPAESNESVATAHFLSPTKKMLTPP